jgi:hypothetical protein
MDIIPQDVEPLIFKCLGYHDLTFCKSALEYRDATADKAARKIQNLFICWNTRKNALERKIILNSLRSFSHREFMFFMTWMFRFENMRSTWPAFYALKTEYEGFVKPIMTRFEVWEFIKNHVSMEAVKKIGW